MYKKDQFYKRIQKKNNVSKGQLTWTFCKRLFCSSSSARGQLTRTFCERLFSSSSNARIGVCERSSGRVDSGIFLPVCMWPSRCS